MKNPSMLPLLSSPFAHFFLPSVLFFTYRPYSLENTYSAQMFISAHLSSETVAGIVSAAKVRGDPGHHPGLNTRCAQSQGLDRAGGHSFYRDRSALRTFYPCDHSRPSPDALCVLRRRLEGADEVTPSVRRLAAQARTFHG